MLILKIVLNTMTALIIFIELRAKYKQECSFLNRKLINKIYEDTYQHNNHSFLGLSNNDV